VTGTDPFNLIFDSIPKIILILVVFSEIILLHNATKTGEKDFRKYIFYVFASICVISISALLFTNAGGPYEPLFKGGAALSGFINMFILLFLVRLLI
jgi:hypothetical protein